MKKLILSLLFSVFTVQAVWCQALIDADDPNIRYGGGRINFADTKKPAFDWPGVYISAIFDGSSCAVRFEDAGNNYFNAFVDGALVAKMGPISGTTTYTIAQGLAITTHTVLIIRRNETSGPSGKTSFLGFVLDSGKTLQALPPAPTRKIEYVGDSLTCGYGVEAASISEPFSKEKESAYLSYAAITARYFNADYHLIAKSGYGMIKNYDDSTSTIMFSANPIPSYYEKTQFFDSTNTWNFTWQPDAVVIALGGNDFSGNGPQYWPDKPTFENAYVQFVQKVRAKNPNAHIFCTSYGSIMPSTCTTYVEEIANMFISSGDTKVHFARMEYTLVYPDDYGSWHPNVVGQRKIADSFIPIIGNVMNWAMVDITSPSVVPAVRDGTGVDVSSTLLTTQLSANWDVSVDTGSGIAKYWYAIISDGGSRIVDWTDNGLNTTITKTDLTLTVGTTYYFSVKAENGAGLQSAATNSNGQTVSGTASTPIVTTPSKVADAYVYPNPFSFTKEETMIFQVKSLAGADINIYTVSGRLVRKITAGKGVSEIGWDGTNKAGEKITAGLYMYCITDNNGNKKTGKIIITR